MTLDDGFEALLVDGGGPKLVSYEAPPPDRRFCLLLNAIGEPVGQVEPIGVGL